MSLKLPDMRHTRLVYCLSDQLWTYRRLAQRLIPTLHWRRHGIGVLQGYVHEGGGRELRMHIWSPRLVLPGIAESGNVHNHRFGMYSTLLSGTLLHTEYNIPEGYSEGGYKLYEVVHARAHTKENRAKLFPRKGTVGIEKIEQRISAGMSYGFDRGAFHSTTPISDIAVTLVEKFDQVDERAMVLAPATKPPVPAFGKASDLDPDTLQQYLVQAIASIETAYREEEELETLGQKD